ncbi:heterokaryon incompatibility protein-domain-containing protein [Aspergillus caelatus]|uniref:Heterokaryon incompatibility protein-domain-containing protein n=1 Tax=Aspergillus caelatus TaxID=61420 RepID=A0A5N7AF57_9EURO|nr:heterokaryon incompatibility protein-domain-containing protein [Aspergillus caelatus]KAE8368355.1 heterokaryon incompatibility protein-domain-containing protein [Aspergillus caelatus]
MRLALFILFAYSRKSKSILRIPFTIDIKLSYVWGDASMKAGILVNNVAFNITQNLSSALHSLRYITKPRVMLIDFICINQEDLKEKNTQLPLMGQIYRDANAVIAYVRTLTPQIEQAILLSRRFPRPLYTLAGMMWQMGKVKSYFSPHTWRQELLDILNAVEGCLQIRSSPYWSRMWTFQEYVLPGQDPICICGNETFKLPELMQLESNFDSLIAASLNRVYTLPIKDRSEARQNQVLLRHLDKSAQNSAPYGNRYVTLLTASAATPRDRVYALYRISPGMQELRPPDYNKPVDQVIMAAATYLFEVEIGTHLFESFHLREGNLTNPSHPSWLPDFSKSTHETRFDYWRQGRALDSSLLIGMPQGRESSFGIPFRLHLWARRVGVCDVAFRFSADREEIITQIMRVFEETASNWGNSLGQSNLPQRFFDACLAHTPKWKEFSINDVLEALIDIRQAIRDGNAPEDMTTPRAPLDYALMEELPFLAHRIVFSLSRSSTGGFGIGVETVEDGDVVVLPEGMTAAVALRRWSYDSNSDAEVYKMVGLTFVEGIREQFGSRPTPLLVDLRGQGLEEFIVL